MAIRSEMVFLVAHLVVVVAVLCQSGFTIDQTVIALALVVPTLLTHVALFVPRLLQARAASRQELTWAVCGTAIFIVAMAVAIRGNAYAEGIFSNQGRFSTGLAVFQSAYAVYGVWFARAHFRADYAVDMEIRRHLQETTFDVFLSYNSDDRAEVQEIANLLREAGIIPWLDAWHIRAGESIQLRLESELTSASAVAVFLGKSGFGPWHQKELRAADSEQILPVFLKSADLKAEFPKLLQDLHAVDFRDASQHALARLVDGIERNRQRNGTSELADA